MNWGKWIVTSFVLFAGFIATLVFVCVREDISLVNKDYYKDELVYEDQLVRLKNAESLMHKPIIGIDSQRYLVVQFDQFPDLQKGELLLFCPSNARLDKKIDIRSSHENIQRFDLVRIPKGMYKARLRWTMNDKEYYTETVISI